VAQMTLATANGRARPAYEHLTNVIRRCQVPVITVVVLCVPYIQLDYYISQCCFGTLYTVSCKNVQLCVRL